MTIASLYYRGESETCTATVEKNKKTAKTVLQDSPELHPSDPGDLDGPSTRAMTNSSLERRQKNHDYHCVAHNKIMANPFTTILRRLHLPSSKSDATSHHIPKSERKAAKLADRDHERTTNGLLRIALKRHSSVNSFTAKDPSVHYRRREDHEKWMGHEAGGVRLGGEKDWRARESGEGR